MKLKVFAVKDLQVNAYGTPMFLQATGQAIRSFTDEVNRAADDNLMYKHPDDYTLSELGEFDTETGTFSTDTPRVIASGSQTAIRN